MAAATKNFNPIRKAFKMVWNCNEMHRKMPEEDRLMLIVFTNVPCCNVVVIICVPVEDVWALWPTWTSIGVAQLNCEHTQRDNLHSFHKPQQRRIRLFTMRMGNMIPGGCIMFLISNHSNRDYEWWNSMELQMGKLQQHKTRTFHWRIWFDMFTLFNYHFVWDG